MDNPREHFEQQARAHWYKLLSAALNAAPPERHAAMWERAEPSQDWIDRKADNLESLAQHDSNLADFTERYGINIPALIKWDKAERAAMKGKA